MRKAELHIHLDGSIRIKTLQELAIKDNILPRTTTEYEVKHLVSINKNDKTLVDYLKKFDLPIQILQNQENITRVTKELVEDLGKEGVIYAEIRVAPIQHIKCGLKPNQVIDSILEGINLGKENYDIDVNLLLCAMRHLNEDLNFFLIDLAEKYKNKGVVGLDLAGNEKDYKVEEFTNFFIAATKKDIPFTIHAGEASGAESVINAIKIGAKRIGHGVRAIESKEALNLLVKNQVCLELCPKSNIDTNVFPDFKDYPIKTFIDMNIPVCLNSDNRTVSATNLDNEINILNKNFIITENDFLNFNINAIKHAFISEKDKTRLINKLKGV